jgi:hypothetical protein
MSPPTARAILRLTPNQGEHLVSHIVTVKTEVRDAAAVRAACQRLGLAEPIQGTVKLFSGEATGLAVQLPDWTYPVVCDTATGKAKFDNFEGRWGDQKELDRFMQAYAVEKAKLESRRRGHSTTEQTLPDGSIKLTIQVAGGAA